MNEEKRKKEDDILEIIDVIYKSNKSLNDLPIDKKCDKHNTFITKDNKRYGIIYGDTDSLCLGEILFACECIEYPLFIEIKNKMGLYFELIKKYNHAMMTGDYGSEVFGELGDLRSYFKDILKNDKVKDNDKLKKILEHYVFSIKMAVNSAYGTIGNASRPKYCSKIMFNTQLQCEYLKKSKSKNTPDFCLQKEGKCEYKTGDK